MRIACMRVCACAYAHSRCCIAQGEIAALNAAGASEVKAADGQEQQQQQQQQQQQRDTERERAFEARLAAAMAAARAEALEEVSARKVGSR